MFIFKNFPTLQNAHNTYKKLVDATYKANIKYEKSGKEVAKVAWTNASDEVKKYEINVYSKLIFDALKSLRPEIVNSQPKNYVLNPTTMEYEVVSESKPVETWENTFGNDFDKLSETLKSQLVGMIEEDGRYRLPKEYYDGRDKFR